MIALLIALGWAMPAWAHAVLLEHEPAANATLAAAPSEVRLRFDEVVTPVLVRVLDASGKPVTGPARYRQSTRRFISPCPRPCRRAATS